MNPKCVFVEVEKFTLLGKKRSVWSEEGVCFYFIENMTELMPLEVQRKDIHSAFDDWNKELDDYGLVFMHTTFRSKATLIITFVGGNTGRVPEAPFDQYLSDPDIIGLTPVNGNDIYLIENKGFVEEPTLLNSSVKHEIGHFLMLGHTTSWPLDIMYFKWELGNYITFDSRKGLSKLYREDQGTILIWDVAEVAFIAFAIFMTIQAFT